MSRLLETIKVFDGKLWNVEYHNARFNNARKELFYLKNKIDLNEIIKIPLELKKSLYKCRVVYTNENYDIEFIPYIKKKIFSLQLVYNNDIVYQYKYEDRSVFDGLLLNIKADEIIIIKNNLITDSSYSNLVFSDGTKYFTPSTPLLKGTKREQLIDEGKLTEEEIRVKDLKRFKYVFLINAMLDIDDNRKIPVEKIISL